MRHVELSHNRHDDAHAGVMIAQLKGAPSDEVVSRSEVTAFCERLKGYDFTRYPDLFSDPDNTPLPQGYRNVRILDARDGDCLGSIWWVGSGDMAIEQGRDFGTTTERPRARKIISTLLFMPFEEVIAWRSTVALPDRRPGTLELMVDIDTRPRELLMVDGSPLPKRIVDFIAAQAPAKAIRTAS